MKRSYNKNRRAKSRRKNKKTALTAALVLAAAVVVCAAAVFVISRLVPSAQQTPQSGSAPAPSASQAAGSASVSEAAPSAAASSEAAASSPASSVPTASSALTRAESTIIDFFLEGQTESVPATLYVGSGYSLYVPTEGWSVSSEAGRTTWLSTDNEMVGFSVTTYTGTTAAAARSAYIAGSGFEFDELNGGTLGDPLIGWDEDGDALGLVSAEKNGTVYILAWTYPEEATEGFGARLQQIAETFELM